MSVKVQEINAWFKKALKSEITELREELALTPRQDKIFELFYLNKIQLELISDKLNVSLSVTNKELEIIRDKIYRYLYEK